MYNKEIILARLVLDHLQPELSWSLAVIDLVRVVPIYFRNTTTEAWGKALIDTQ